MKHYDYIVVGTGAGNIVTDAAIDAGKKVAIIEQGKFGGTCLNRGCIPTKTLLTPVDYKRDFDRLKAAGLVEGDLRLNYDNIQKRMWDYIKSNSQAVLDEYRAEPNVDIYQGRGFFTGKKTLRVRYPDDSLSGELTADVVLLANGAKTRIPDTVKGLDKVDYVTSETFFADKFPQKPYGSLTILGGGVIAAEFASFFAGLGTKVTIVQRNPKLLPHFDQDIVAVLMESLKDQGVDLYLNSDMVEVQRQADDQLEFLLEDRSGRGQSRLKSEALMIATGLVSTADQLAVAQSAIAQDKRGYIRTNEFLETSVEGVYSIGDANGKFQLRHVANYEAETLAYNLYGRLAEAEEVGFRSLKSLEGEGSGQGTLEDENSEKRPVDTFVYSGEKADLLGLRPRRRVRYDIVPAAVFSDPQIASVGLGEDQAKAQGLDYKLGKFYYGSVSKAYAMGFAAGEEKEFVKVIAEPASGLIRGVQIVGPEAAILVQIYANLLNTGLYEYEPVEEDIASAETLRERKEFKGRYLDPRTSAALNLSMTIHPALSEVATWAASELEEA